MVIFQTLIAFIALSVLITVHEYGHFIVARRCGVFIECFSIGFGKPLMSWYDSYGTHYIICIFPLGGYVKMLESSSDIKNHLHSIKSFNNQSLLHRAAIISAGPLANFILAIICYWIIFIYGITNIKPIISEVKKGSIAFQSEITSNMELKSIADVNTDNWDDVRMALLTQIGNKNIPVKLALFDQVSHQKIIKKFIDLDHWHLDPYKQDPITAFGINPYQSSSTESIVDRIYPNSIASKIGLHAGDEILKVNGQSFKNWSDLMISLCNNFNQTIRLMIKRQSKIFSINFTDNLKHQLWKNGKCFFGAIPHHIPLDEKFQNQQKYNPITALLMAGKRTWQLSKLTLRILKQVIMGKLSLHTLSGPISIAQGAIISAKHGLLQCLMFLALISINIGMMNLFPLPILDGGQILFLLLEKIKGQSLSDQFKKISWNISTIFLILIMTLTIFNDCSHILFNITN
ncbi:MAG: sigma E protease regulator RseP [Candidatus Dasytiphilus stammeri]